ncbi:MAG: MFS transporter [Anaerolineales bacterium]|jgi:MFS family permease
MSEQTTPHPRFAAFQHRNFTLLWSGLIVSNVGTWMQNVAQGWLMLQLTNSPLWLGYLGLSFALPMIFLPLVGGVVADHVDRIRLLYVTQSGQLLLALALAILSWTGQINAWYLLVASFLNSALLAFDNPSRQALVPDLVPQQHLMNAISLNSASYNGAALFGPALAGALLAPLGAGTLFFINAVSYLAVIIALTGVKDVRRHSGVEARAPLGKAIMSGLSYAWKVRFILALLGLSALAAIFGRSYQNLLPVFARDIWKDGEVGYGILLSAAGGGALIGAFWMASFRHLKRQGAVMIVSGLVFSLCLVLFAISPSLLLGGILLFIGGVASTVYSTMITTFIQVTVPNHIRGRLMSLYAITFIGLPSLGALGSGFMAQMLGGLQGAPRAVLIGGALVGVVLLAVASLFWKRELAPIGPALAEIDSSTD